MIHLERMFCDLILSTLEEVQRWINFIKRVKPQPSLIALNLEWCTNSEWMDRLISYKQLDLWTADK